MNRQLQRGMTLIELVITIVIIGIAVAAMYSAMAAIASRSADPMLRQQSLAIAEAYLEEILLQSFMPITDPGCDVRSCFQDVRAYDGWSENPPRDIDANTVKAADGTDLLTGYTVTVAVDDSVSLNGVAALRVDISVTDPSNSTEPGLVLSGWRTCYGEKTAAGANACP